MGDSFRTVHVTGNPLEAEALGELLWQHGIVARVIGTRNAALVGVGAHILEQRVEVPAGAQAEAGELIAAFLNGAVEEPAALAEMDEPAPPGAPAPAPAERPEPSGSSPRSRFMAALFVMLLFGGSHLYARRFASAALIAAAQIGSLVALGLWSGRPAALSAAALFLMLLALDFVGGQRAVLAYNRGERPGAARQLAVTALGVLALLVASPLVVRLARRIPLPPAPAPSAPEEARPPAVPAPLRHLCGHPRSG